MTPTVKKTNQKGKKYLIDFKGIKFKQNAEFKAKSQQKE